MHDQQDQIDECSKKRWSRECVKLLIDEMGQNMLRLINRNFNQQKIWKEIAGNMAKRGYNFTEDQCFTKWKNLKQKYRSVKDLHNSTGNSRIEWEYFESMDEILNVTPEIRPVSLASNLSGFQVLQESELLTMDNPNKENTQASSHNTAHPKSSASIAAPMRRKRTRASTFQEKLLEQTEIHHRENMKMQEKFIHVLEKNLDKRQ
ncbi:uncharacterized protein [Prorops nasuta]|uniref:uncharacterized protein n=1 Tax=Prorops nasuta TaxID=863751 RepID=UPI0034CD72DE